MNSSGLWQALRAKLAPVSVSGRRITVHHLVLSEHDVAGMQAVFDKIGQALTLRLELQRNAGELVLVDVDLAGNLSTELVTDFAEDRPVIAVHGLQGRRAPLLADAEAFERCRADLQRQLMELPLVQRRSPQWRGAGWGPPGMRGEAGDSATGPDTLPAAASSGYDSTFDTVVDALPMLSEDVADGQRSVLEAVLRGIDDREQRPLCASYGAEANLQFDFRSRLVTLDPLAHQHLRLRREVPHPAPSTRPQAGHIVRELDEVLWDLGMASAQYALLGAPVNWWRTPVVCLADCQIERYTRLPVHLELAHRLHIRPMTPSALRCQVRSSVTDLRGFLQAGLMLRLLHWAPGSEGAAC